MSQFSLPACSLLARRSDVGGESARPVLADWSRPVSSGPIRRRLPSVIAIGGGSGSGTIQGPPEVHVRYLCPLTCEYRPVRESGRATGATGSPYERGYARATRRSGIRDPGRTRSSGDTAPCGPGRPHSIGRAALAQNGRRTALRAGTANDTGLRVQRPDFSRRCWRTPEIPFGRTP